MAAKAVVGHELIQQLRIPMEGAVLEGDLVIPEGARGLVLFAHGSGSSRRSPRNRMVAKRLQVRGLGTLLFDLLTTEEGRRDEMTAEHRFDLDLLSIRVLGATVWVRRQPWAEGLALGYFGASTGSAAALMAAAALGADIGAVVSRGGRPDLAEEALPQVVSPTLLIVGGHDFEVLHMNEDALHRLRCPKALEVVPGATHLFEEPGALEAVADLAGAWFERHLGAVESFP
ncbi:MAG TPA: hypothetical protein VJ600_02275 [Holophagaceae bacterium]|nr:hypothetical protein [Holophagaceae bacterium]